MLRRKSLSGVNSGWVLDFGPNRRDPAALFPSGPRPSSGGLG